MPGPLLETRELRRAFGGVRAVDGVALAVAPGELRALIGPNGAGKTTLFDLLTGHLRPDGGEVWLDGRRIDGLPPHRVGRHGLARTFQIPAVFGSLTVRENVQVAVLARQGRTLSPWGRARAQGRSEAESWLERVGLAGQAGRPAGVLAYGDLKKLELAIALAGAPRLLLLDEPTAGMAPGERRALIGLVAGLARANALTLLFTEHDMDVVFRVADRITVLHQGRILADGAPAAVRADPEVQRVYLGEL